MKFKFLNVALTGLVFSVTCLVNVASAGLINISVEQDISLNSEEVNSNWNNQGHEFLWVGDSSGERDYQGVFGFDMSTLTNLLNPGDTLLINSFTFNAFHNYYHDENSGTGMIDISMGSSDLWDDDTASYSSLGNLHGSTLDTVLFSTLVNDFVAWDVSSIDVAEYINDNYLTFYLTIPDADIGNNDNWNDFESEEWTGNNEAFLAIDYTIVPSSVPEPSTLAIFALGVIGLSSRRFKKQS